MKISERLEELKENENQDFYCVIGSPVKHSLSPRMHNLAFKINQLPFYYFPLEVAKEELPEIVKQLKEDEKFSGLNVTTPLKEDILRFCDEISEVSKLTGSVNTVKDKDGKWYGTTTDGIGFFNGLKNNGVDLKDKKILLLGAGGAARVIAAQSLFEDIDQITIFNRTLKKAQDLKEKLEPTAEKNQIKIEAFPLDDKEALSSKLKEADILVNATSVGMDKKNETLLINPEDLNDNLVVCEIVYKEKTQLAKEAEKRGLKVVDGLPMLLYQGAESFKIWTGKEFPVQEVRDQVFNN